MTVESGFVDNDGVRIHHLSAGGRGSPVLVAPGLSDAAEDHRDLVEALSPRRVVAMSFRGRGRSGSPTTGYDLDDHVSDLDAVVEGLGLRDIVLFGHSRAASYAVAYAATRPDRVASLVLGDAAPVHRAFAPEWVGGFGASRWRGQRVDERVTRDLLRAIQREAREVDLWDALAALRIPVVAVLAGETPPERRAPVAERYRRCGAQVAVLENADHTLWEPEPERLVRVLEEIASAVDRGS